MLREQDQPIALRRGLAFRRYRDFTDGAAVGFPIHQHQIDEGTTETNTNQRHLPLAMALRGKR